MNNAPALFRVSRWQRTSHIWVAFYKLTYHWKCLRKQRHWLNRPSLTAITNVFFLWVLPRLSRKSAWRQSDHLTSVVCCDVTIRYLSHSYTNDIECERSRWDTADSGIAMAFLGILYRALFKGNKAPPPVRDIIIGLLAVCKPWASE